MTLVRGRIFNDEDIETTPHVAIVDEAAARIWWPNQDFLIALLVGIQGMDLW
jgi:hypothetical protein